MGTLCLNSDKNTQYSIHESQGLQYRQTPIAEILRQFKGVSGAKRPSSVYPTAIFNLFAFAVDIWQVIPWLFLIRVKSAPQLNVFEFGERIDEERIQGSHIVTPAFIVANGCGGGFAGESTGEATTEQQASSTGQIDCSEALLR